MSRWLWIAAAVLLAVAAVSVWFAFQRPDFFGGLAVLAIGAIWKALAPALLKPASPEDLARQQANADRGGERLSAGQSARPFNRQKGE